MSLDVYLVNNFCPHCKKGDEVYHANVTHNLNSMAQHAGVYEHLWHPEAHDPPITKAGELIEPLKKAVAEMREDPERFKKFEASNGWGTYENFLPWIERYIAACEEYPDAYVETWT